MTAELSILIATAAGIAFVHTILGPDHYLPFVAMARARGWTLRKTVNVTLLCGLGHLVGSVLLGVVGIAFGTALSQLEWVESIRGEIAAWLLVGFGLAYMAWGLRRAWRNKPHAHWHEHEDGVHYHAHDHQREHAHVHEREGASITPWVIFIIFVLGPCEPLIPLLMYPAATHSVAGVIAVTAVFGVVTVATMLTAVVLATVGLQRFSFRGLQRYDHALAGFAILACGLAITVLGL
jgi:sulfite exporter TauE/SafE